MLSAARQSWWVWGTALAAVVVALGVWGLLARPSALADEGGGEPEGGEETQAALVIRDYPCILKSDDTRDVLGMGCHYAKAKGAFVVDFEIVGLGDEVEVRELRFRLKDIPLPQGGTTSHTVNCITKFTVTPQARSLTMYQYSTVPTGPDSNKYTLFVPQSVWDDIEINVPQEDGSVQREAELIDHDIVKGTAGGKPIPGI